MNQAPPKYPEAESLETPVVNIKTAEFLSLTGWQIVLNWLEKNAPKDIYHLAQDLTFFDFYQDSILRTGKVDADTNQAVGERLIDITNRISNLQEW